MLLFLVPHLAHLPFNVQHQILKVPHYHVHSATPCHTLSIYSQHIVHVQCQLSTNCGDRHITWELSRIVPVRCLIFITESQIARIFGKPSWHSLNMKHRTFAENLSPAHRPHIEYRLLQLCPARGILNLCTVERVESRKVNRSDTEPLNNQSAIALHTILGIQNEFIEHGIYAERTRSYRPRQKRRRRDRFVSRWSFELRHPYGIRWHRHFRHTFVQCSSAHRR